MSRMPGTSGHTAGRRGGDRHVDQFGQPEEHFPAFVRIFGQVGGDNRDGGVGHIACQEMASPVIDDAPGRGVLFEPETIGIGRLLVIVAPEHLQAPELGGQDEKGHDDQRPIYGQP